MRVVLPSFGNKSRKTTKSDPSTGDQFWESRETAKFDAPVGLLGRIPRTECKYDSLDETNWPCASSCQVLETNRGKRQSPIRLRGISWGSLFTFFSTEFRADRWVNGGSNNEPLTRWGDEAFGDLNRVIVAQIEENDKVRPVYGGSVLRMERNGQVRRAGRSSRAYSTHGV